MFMMMSANQLDVRFGWPENPPNIETNLKVGWLCHDSKQALSHAIRHDAACVFEIGAFAGLSTRYIAGLAPQAQVYSIDHWRGSAEHHSGSRYGHFIPILWELWVMNCWSLRDRVAPVRGDSVDGLRKLKSLKREPDVIYVDGDHSYEGASRDALTCCELFPNATLVFDDHKLESVAKVVSEMSAKYSRETVDYGKAAMLKTRM